MTDTDPLLMPAAELVETTAPKLSPVEIATAGHDDFSILGRGWMDNL